MKFLVVDDSPTMRRIVVNSLNRIGWFDIVQAADGKEALEALDESIGCVITNWNMPHLSGLELVRLLRETPGTRGIPILMMSARSMREDIVTAISAGVDGYIVKPFTHRVLKEKVDLVLKAATTR